MSLAITEVITNYFFGFFRIRLINKNGLSIQQVNSRPYFQGTEVIIMHEILNFLRFQQTFEKSKVQLSFR